MRIFIQLLFIIFLANFTLVNPVFAKEYTLTAGVSLEQLPKTFFGSWRVEASLIKASNYGSFKPKSADLWN